MNFCVKCGAKLEVGKKFCPQCGCNLGANEIKASEESIANTQSVEVVYFEDNNEIVSEPSSIRSKLVLSKKSKLSIVGICIALVLLIGFYVAGRSSEKPSNVVSKFEKAVASDNKGELIKILYSNDNRLEINEKSITPLLTYFKDNPSYLNTVVQDLNKDALKLEQSKGIPEPSGNSSKEVLSLISTGKKFLFFPNYKISIKPAFIQVKTGIKDVDISLDSTKIGKSDSDNYSKEFGPFVPGKYKLLANYKGTYLSLSEPYDIDLVAAGNDRTKIDVFKNVGYVRVRSEYPDAEIFVNGKDTKVKIADAQNFGPLSNNTKIYATVNKNGKNLKSSEYTVLQGDSDVNLSFTEAENIVKNAEGNLHDLIRWYTYYFTQAVNNNNFSIVEDYIYPGGKLYSEQQSYIPSTYSKGIRETIMSFNVLSYKLSDDNKSGTISTEEVYNIDNNGSSSIKTFKYSYTFKYNEEKGHFQLDSIAVN